MDGCFDRVELENLVENIYKPDHTWQKVVELRLEILVFLVELVIILIGEIQLIGGTTTNSSANLFND